MVGSSWPQAPARGAYFGLLSEVAVWGRALAASEILQRYRRGSERIRMQVRGCADAGCAASPPWQGPDGTPNLFL